MQTKLCTKCGEQKPRDTFAKNNSKADKLQTFCKLCAVIVAREYKKANREKVQEYAREYREANRKKLREAVKRYTEANFEKVKKYRESNPEKFAAYNAKRRAAKLQRTPTWLTKEQLDEIETFYTVALAFRLYTGLTYHVDHIVPLQGKKVCGLHVPWNLQVISATDNLKKSNLFEDYE